MLTSNSMSIFSKKIGPDFFFGISGQIGGKNSQKIMDTKNFSKFFHKNQTFCVKIPYIPQNFSKRRKMERRRHFLRLTGEKFSPVKRRILRKKLSLVSLHLFMESSLPFQLTVPVAHSSWPVLEMSSDLKMIKSIFYDLIFETRF